MLLVSGDEVRGSVAGEEYIFLFSSFCCIFLSFVCYLFLIQRRPFRFCNEIGTKDAVSFLYRKARLSSDVASPDCFSLYRTKLRLHYFAREPFMYRFLTFQAQSEAHR